jgi:O-antigen/teichoic acid export membrane protein
LIEENLNSITKYIKDFLSNPAKLKTFSWILFPSILAVLANIILGKLIAVYIEPSEFGVYSLQFAIYGFFNSLLIIPLINAYKRFINNYDTHQIYRYFNKILALFTLLSFVVLSIVYLVDDSILSISLILIISIFLLFQSFYTIRLAHLNLHFNHGSFGIFSIINSLVLIAFFVVIVVVFGQNDAQGIWLNAVLCSLMSFILIQIYFNKKNIKEVVDERKAFIDKKFNNQLLKYLTPLFILAFVGWINNYGDRYLIKYLMDDFEVGLYSAGYGLGSKTSFVVSPVLIYLTPKIYQKINESIKEVDQLILSILLKYFVGGALICVVMYFMQDFIGYFFLSPDYKNGFVLIPIIAFAFLFYNSVFIIETKFYAQGNTKFVLYHNIVGAVANLSLNLLLIPRFGIKGAGYACILSFSMQFLSALYLMKKNN